MCILGRVVAAVRREKGGQIILSVIVPAVHSSFGFFSIFRSKKNKSEGNQGSARDRKSFEKARPPVPPRSLPRQKRTRGKGKPSYYYDYYYGKGEGGRKKFIDIGVGRSLSTFAYPIRGISCFMYPQMGRDDVTNHFRSPYIIAFGTDRLLKCSY